MSSTISTRLTKLLGIDHPIILAPMAFASNPALVSAVTNAGAFGFLAAGLDTAEQLSTNLNTVRRTLNIPEHEPLPIGVGFITWLIQPDDPRLSVVLQHRPRAIWFAFGRGAQVDSSTKVHVGRVRREAPGTLVFVMVGTVEEAVEVAGEGVDGIVVQGGEAGGHGASSALPLSTLLTAVLAAIPKDGPVTIAAGGIMIGAQLASVLALGADGAVLGTRFLLTPESGYDEGKKEIVRNAEVGGTVRSLAFDEVFELTWPERVDDDGRARNYYDGRAINNAIITDKEDGVDLEERRKRVEENVGGGREIVWAGAGSGLVREIMPAKDVVEEVVKDAIASLEVGGASVGM